MNSCRHRDLGQPEAGGITIIVALMLLVLLTIAAVGMSRNSLREIVTSGFTRQGAMTRNVADSGIEWSIYWIYSENAKAATGTMAPKLAALKTAFGLDFGLAGVAKDVNSSNPSAPSNYAPGGSLDPDFTLPSPTGVTAQGYTLGMTAMGKLPIVDTSQGSGSGAFAPGSGKKNLNAPDLWAIRSDAQVIQGGITFIHAKEAWISTPVL